MITGNSQHATDAAGRAEPVLKLEHASKCH